MGGERVLKDLRVDSVMRYYRILQLTSLSRRFPAIPTVIWPCATETSAGNVDTLGRVRNDPSVHSRNSL